MSSNKRVSACAHCGAMPRVARPTRAPLSRLGVFASAEVGGSHLIIIRVRDILYCIILGRTRIGKLIDARWYEVSPPRPMWVYVRTADGVYRTRFRSLAGIRRCLPAYFAPANHRGTAINCEKIKVAELSRVKRFRVGFRLPSRPDERLFEWIFVSRKCAPEIRRRFGWAPRRECKRARRRLSATDLRTEPRLYRRPRLPDSTQNPTQT